MAVPSIVEQIAFLEQKLRMLERLHAVTRATMQKFLDHDAEHRRTSAAVEELKRTTGATNK